MLLPLPESPVNTVRLPRGMRTLTFLRLFSFAPFTYISSFIVYSMFKRFVPLRLVSALRTLTSTFSPQASLRRGRRFVIKQNVVITKRRQCFTHEINSRYTFRHDSRFPFENRGMLYNFFARKTTLFRCESQLSKNLWLVAAQGDLSVQLGAINNSIATTRERFVFCLQINRPKLISFDTNIRKFF